MRATEGILAILKNFRIAVIWFKWQNSRTV